MAFSSTEFVANGNLNNAHRLASAVGSETEMQKLTQQAADDALWRIAQNNAMAKVKGMAKLAEAANQLS